MQPSNDSLRIAAMADLHCPRLEGAELRSLFEYAADGADAMVLCGDLTDYGKPEEARALAAALPAARRVPVLAVLGNHDYECGAQDQVEQILKDHGVTVLNGTTTEIRGVGFAGVKGFAGGFGDRALQPWGEPTLKQFVQETVEEALRLESALAKLQTSQRVVLMHYSPILDTVLGEPADIVPFLGSSRLEEPLNRYAVSAVFHGHAHHGSVEGRTREGTPVYNVAVPLLRRLFPEQQPVRFLEVPVAKAPVTR
ncbi:metallophosphoesterase family protein [Candidatus Nitrospira bockiana]